MPRSTRASVGGRGTSPVAVARLALTTFADGEVRLSDEVELYQRTYMTLLALERGDGAARARALAHGDGIEPASAGRQRGARPRCVPLRGPPPAGRHRRRRARGDGPGHRGADGQRLPGRFLAGGRGARPPAPVVRQRHRHARSAARQHLGRRRPGADAGRLPDRVEQDPGAHTRRRLASRERLPRRTARGVRARTRWQRRGLGAPARRLGRDLRRADAADRPEATVAADSDARGHAHRLRAPHPAVVGAGQRQARRIGAHRASAVFRQLQLPQPREHRHRHRPRRASPSWSSSSSNSTTTTSCARS